MIARRDFIHGLALAGAGGALGRKVRPAAAELPPETARIRLVQTFSMCQAPQYVAEELLKKDLESLDGVAAVKVNGGLEEEIQVGVDEGKLALVGLKPSDVQAVLARENIKKVEVLEYPELGMEAIWRIEVENFPAFIVIDDKGNDFFKELNLG